jgi:hypothetical protein
MCQRRCTIERRLVNKEGNSRGQINGVDGVERGCSFVTKDLKRNV